MKKTKIGFVSGRVYEEIVRSHRSKFTELCLACKLESNELCTALLHLIQQGKVRQDWNTDGVFYRVTEKSTKDD